MQRLGMRKPTVRHPESFAVSGRVDDKSVFIPASGRSAIVRQHRFRGWNGRTSIGVDHTPVPIATAEKNQDAADIPLFDELKSVRHLKLTWAALRQAAA